jgi:ParB family transcriptional regulator, chromosome partitioning protein
LYETLLKKRGKFNSCKKGELIKIFLESGVDLAGVVPDEVLEKTAPTRQ